MILNHKAAIELLVDDAERVGFDLITFRSLQRCAVGKPADQPTVAGSIVASTSCSASWVS